MKDGNLSYVIEMRLSGLNDLKIIFTLLQSVGINADLPFGLLCSLVNQSLRVKLFSSWAGLKKSGFPLFFQVTEFFSKSYIFCSDISCTS